MADLDEAIIRAIQRVNDPDCEPERVDSDNDSDVSSEAETSNVQEPLDPDMQRLLEDNAIRQQLGIGGAFTGPKGVLADRKFHRQQEAARAEIKMSKYLDTVASSALSSGWMQRQIEADKLEMEDDDEFLKEYRAKRLAELQSQSLKPRFGRVQDLKQESFVSAIDDEDSEVMVVIHLYQSSVESCRIVNAYFDELARRYPLVKFARIVSTVADENFDMIALPAILVYRAGDLVTTCLRITDEIEGWATTGRVSIQDFEQYFINQGILEQYTASGLVV